MKKRNTIRLTEGQLHNIIKESTRIVLNELSYGLMKKSYDDAMKQGRIDLANNIKNKFLQMYGGKHSIPQEVSDSFEEDGDKFDRTLDHGHYQNKMSLENPDLDSTISYYNSDTYHSIDKDFNRHGGFSNRVGQSRTNKDGSSTQGLGKTYNNSRDSYDIPYQQQMRKAQELSQQGYDQMERWKKGDIDSKYMRTDI